MSGDELGLLFVPPDEPDTFAVLVTLVSLVVVALALVALIRGRVLTDSVFTAFLAAGLLFLSGFTYALGDLFLLEESQQVEFCGSCHQPMAPVVENMQNGDANLAALHYQTGAVSHARACYQCHSGYGMHGTVNAKLAGIRHMLITASGRFEFPLELHGGFDLDSCLNCHAAAKPFRDVPAHHDPDLQEALLSGELGCTGKCHVTAHPESALMGVEP